MELKLLKATVAGGLLVALAGFSNYFYQKMNAVIPAPAKKIEAAQARDFSPGEITRQQRKKFVQINPGVVGISVVNVDFFLNERRFSFKYFEDRQLESAWDDFIISGQSTPLFGSEEGNNQRLVNLINGQFFCVPTTETVPGKLIPLTNEKSITTCLVPIPPGFGDFTGFISVFLNYRPDVKEVRQIDEATKKLSLEIYERDMGKPRRFDFR